MKFYNWLNESRTQKLDKDEFMQLIETKCSEALKEFKRGNYIFRGREENNKIPYLVTNPTGKRKSAYARNNYYTLIFNNDPKWSNFPKREIICTYDFDEADDRGRAYYVFPYDGAKIGECPKSDIWYSFKGITSLNKLNYDLEEILKVSLKDKFTNIRKYSKLKKVLSGLSIDDVDPTLNDTASDFVWYKHGFDNLYEYITNLLDPKRNNFKIETVSSFINNGESEVWTDVPCAMIRDDYIRKIVEII